MKFLFIGDVVGSPGREMLKTYLPKLKMKYRPTATIVNGENAAGGKGITEKVAKELLGLGVQVITLGNHTWDQKNTGEFLDRTTNVIRPANFPPEAPGVGYTLINVNDVKVGVINLQGRVFLPAIDCPFRKADQLIQIIKQETPYIIVDFHAEATSEMQALGWYLDGKVSMVVGTHTHVQTADERLLTGGTAFMTDVGMTGPQNGILGMKKEAIIERFRTAMPARFEVLNEGPRQLNGVLVTVDDKTGLAQSIERIRIDDSHPFVPED